MNKNGKTLANLKPSTVLTSKTKEVLRRHMG
jgi:hypothetical protein